MDLRVRSQDFRRCVTDVAAEDLLWRYRLHF